MGAVWTKIEAYNSNSNSTNAFAYSLYKNTNACRITSLNIAVFYAQWCKMPDI